MLVRVFIPRVVEILGGMRYNVSEDRQLTGVAKPKEDDEDWDEPPRPQQRAAGVNH